MSAMTHVKREEGFTLVELLIGTVIMIVGIFAVIAAFDATRRMSNNNEAQTVRAQVAEKELQQIVSQGYDAIGLNSVPTHSTDPNNPNYYVTNGSPSVFQWDLTDSTRKESLCT